MKRQIDKIAIIGSGYVGLTTAAVLAKVGFHITCIDIDLGKVYQINSGKSHFYEPLLDGLITEAIDNGKLQATTSYVEGLAESDADIAIICVGTPAKEDGSSNLDYIYSAAESIAEHGKENVIVTTKSTVPPGTGKKILELYSNKNRGDIAVLSTPEFLAEGSAVLDSFNIDRLVVGGNDEASKQAYVDLFQQVDDYSRKQGLKELEKLNSSYRNKFTDHTKTPFKDRVVNVSLESAELIKVTANAFLATKISFANSIARITDTIGADVNEVMDGIGMDPRIGRSFLYAGLGWGGGCFPKDVSSLISYADSVGFDFKQLKATADINFDQIDYAYKKVLKILKVDDDSLETANLSESASPTKNTMPTDTTDRPLTGKTLTLWGLAFKPGTNDIRMSPSIALLQKLLDAGARLNVHDPRVSNEQLEGLNNNDGDLIYTTKIKSSVENTDLIIVATDWGLYKDILNEDSEDFLKDKKIFDLRNFVDKNRIYDSKFFYYGLGV